MLTEPASFDDVRTPLAEVTFCVVDLETTGGGPEDCAITEIGAVKTRCGEVVGTFQTLVDPGEPIPLHIELLTGIHHEMIRGAPPLAAVLPTFLEFSGGSVLVAHSAGFDLGFLQHACLRHGYAPLENLVVDTARLARRVLVEEVPNRKLATLAAYFRCEHQPCHRAFDDALATVDVLHNLIERMTGFGVTTLEDLLEFSVAEVGAAFERGWRSSNRG